MLIEVTITEYQGKKRVVATISDDTSCEPFLTGQGANETDAIEELKRVVKKKIVFYQSIEWDKNPKMTVINLD